MKKRILILLALTIAVLLLTAVGCRNNESDLEGKYIATFELNGGTLEYKTSSSNTRVNFAYYPNTYILDPAEIPGYKLYRTDYDFTGWYTSENCLPEEKWDFKNTPFTKETLTLYAGWEKSIHHSFTLYYTDENDELITLNSYRVDAGEKFSDWRGYAKTRTGYTSIGFFTDKELTTPWDSNYAHPGGDVDTDIPVYVSYIVGDWQLVSNYAQFTSALDSNKNIYLTDNIDGAGAKFANKNYTGHLEGNGYTISNLSVPKSGTLIISCTMFNTLGEGAKITNVNFADVKFTLTSVNAAAAESGVRLAAIAKSANGATIQNVTVSGEVTTDYTGALPRVNEAVYDSETTATIEGFTSNITVTVTAND